MGPAGAVLYLDGGVVFTQVMDVRPVLVGYTTFLSTGAIGSRTAANARCNTEFPNTHLCNRSEFRISRSILTLPAAGAWLDYAYSGTSTDPDVNVPCNGFTTGTVGPSAEIALPTGLAVSNSTTAPNCGSTLPLACCTSPSYARLRGYTAFMSTGAIGSRTIANQRCNAEFAGTHLCNRTEFRLARSILPLASAGAWLDYAYSGTSTDPDVNVPCNGFTTGVVGPSAEIALPTGLAVSNSTTLPNCGSTLPLACCD
jgi:hypothetical protein